MDDTENQPTKKRGRRKAGETEDKPPARHGKQAKGKKEKAGDGGKKPFLNLPRPPAGPFELAAATAGRVSDLSPGLMTEFVEIRVQRALSIQGTCRILGIHDDTYKLWRSKGEDDIAAGNYSSLYAQFYTVVPRSRDELLGTLQWLMIKHATGQAEEGEGNFTQLAHVLAILFPERNLEVGRFIAEQNAAVLKAAKTALERFPGAYETLVRVLAEGA